MNEEINEINAKPQPTVNGPILIWLICLICVIIFLGLSAEGNFESWDAVSKWGFYPPGAEWDGKYWNLLTSVFVHLELWHLFFNMYWLWILGGRLEKAIGALRLLAFFLAAAVISSGIQLAAGGTTGIGASGVVYAIFGFMWMTKNHFESFKEVLPERTVIIFVAWLFICLASTLLKIWEVGNAAHFSGLFFGIVVAEQFILKRKVYLAKIAGAILLCAAVIPLFWCPWSVHWVSRRAYQAHSKKDYATAISYYRRSLELGQDPAWVWTNLAIAYKEAGAESDYEEAVKNLEKIDENAARQFK